VHHIGHFLGVVKFLGAIQAEADQEVVLMKEPAPFVVKKNAVGLEGVLNPGAGLPKLFLKLSRPAEKMMLS
jgi:hypothetical protein